MRSMSLYRVNLHSGQEHSRTPLGVTKMIIDSIAQDLVSLANWTIEHYKNSSVSVNMNIWVLDDDEVQEEIDAVNAMNLTELIAYASLHSIDISGLMFEAEIRTAILLHLNN